MNQEKAARLTGLLQRHLKITSRPTVGHDGRSTAGAAVPEVNLGDLNYTVLQLFKEHQKLSSDHARLRLVVGVMATAGAGFLLGVGLVLTGAYFFVLGSA